MNKHEEVADEIIKHLIVTPQNRMIQHRDAIKRYSINTIPPRHRAWRRWSWSRRYESMMM